MSMGKAGVFVLKNSLQLRRLCEENPQAANMVLDVREEASSTLSAAARAAEIMSVMCCGSVAQQPKAVQRDEQQGRRRH